MIACLFRNASQWFGCRRYGDDLYYNGDLESLVILSVIALYNSGLKGFFTGQ